MMLPYVIVVGLAAWQAVEIWHHSHLFARLRAIVETWPHDPRTLREVLCPPTKTIHAEDDEGQPLREPRHIGSWVRSWAAELLMCPFCLSVWVSLLLAWLLWNGYALTTQPPAVLCWTENGLEAVQPRTGALRFLGAQFGAGSCLFVFALAASRLANLGNDLSRGYCRTPGRNELIEQETDDDDRSPGHTSETDA